MIMNKIALTIGNTLNFFFFFVYVNIFYILTYLFFFFFGQILEMTFLLALLIALLLKEAR